MKTLSHIGKIIVVTGILYSFTKVRAFNGYGGYVDNAWEIFTVSTAIVVVGLAVILISKKYKRNKNFK
ncbi:MAG: hypothetical protein V4580_05035 [Bacteroidota bacterium]